MIIKYNVTIEVEDPNVEVQFRIFETPVDCLEYCKELCLQHNTIVRFAVEGNAHPITIQPPNYEA